MVYEAEQISLGRRVALKVLPGHVASDRLALERFRREAKAAARLHHTNIVPVFEVGRDGEVAYYAMQFIQGQGLDQVIDELARLREPGAASPQWETAPGRPWPPRPAASGARARPGRGVAPQRPARDRRGLCPPARSTPAGTERLGPERDLTTTPDCRRSGS